MLPVRSLKGRFIKKKKKNYNCKILLFDTLMHSITHMCIFRVKGGGKNENESYFLHLSQINVGLSLKMVKSGSVSPRYMFYPAI